jgi:ferredoxin
MSLALLVCQGHTLCTLAAPEIFDLGEEDGHAYVTQETVEGDLEKLARKAADGCPERAISLVSEDSKILPSSRGETGC